MSNDEFVDMKTLRPVAITMGDPAGIGPEICGKFFAEEYDSSAFLIGDLSIMERTISQLNLPLVVRVLDDPSEVKKVRGVLDLLPVGTLERDFPIGRIDARAGRAAYDYVLKGIELARAGVIGAIVTAPLHKEALKEAGIPHPGHTEIFAQACGTADFAMMLANDELKTVLVSIHVSLKEAIELVTRERVLKTIRLAHRACQAFGIYKPRVAVAGLNPHAGEGGLFGREDIEEIAPAIQAACSEGIDASGPWAGDTVFMRARRGEFDIVVAQYHDQGLIPVKYMGIANGVNITIGLPFIRTSVDHGTAFDIAGTGTASALSLNYAFTQAVLLMRHEN